MSTVRLTSMNARQLRAEMVASVRHRTLRRFSATAQPQVNARGHQENIRRGGKPASAAAADVVNYMWWWLYSTSKLFNFELKP